jgi:hypothetical protein
LPDSEGTDLKIKSLASVLEGTPFPLETSQGRRYVRLELSSPVLFRVLTNRGGKLSMSKKRNSADILNLSQGGVLLLTDSVLPTEGFLVLTFNLNRLVVLEGVLCRIKRIEPSGEGDFLVGLQFVTDEELKQLASSEELRRLPVKLTSFNHKIREIISGYLRTAKLASEHK